MHGFTDPELAALRGIIAEAPEWRAGLTEQLLLARVVKRENSGSGFFTTITVAEEAPRIDASSPICPEIQAAETGAAVGEWNDR